MLAGILFLALMVVVAVLIAVDVLRTPPELLAGLADRHAHDIDRGAVRAARPVPPPVAVGARFGTGPVATDSFEPADQAFDQMRREMSQSAASEAALRSKFNIMYLNLSRRSQALVERQLRLIEGLEHGERDQQRLASLSKLNRIAMRMHRNSQNLLVLAGQEPPTDWNQPVTLAHLVEAALSEIEDYERVSYEVQPGIAVRGPAVHDSVHLLVELIDNATSFSAADMPVHITGRILSSGGALVDVTDRGIGMPAKEMAYANQQLDNPPAPDIDVPKWMGLLVVARLAAKHGIRVRLNQAELGGLTAMVWLPDEILTHFGAPADLAEQRAATVALAAARMASQDTAAPWGDPAWSARSNPPVPAEPLAARVVMPRTESQPAPRRLPIFDEVESRWPRGAHEASGPSGLAPAPGPAPSGLPRRPPPAAAGPRPGWAVPPEETGPDEPT
jgi:hypothetical protein